MPELCPKARLPKPELVELAPNAVDPNAVVGAAGDGCPKTEVGAALVVMAADGVEVAAVVTAVVKPMVPTAGLSVPPDGGAKIEPGLSDVGAEVTRVSWGTGAAVEVLVVSTAGSETGSAAGGSETGVGVSDGGVTDGGGVGETSRVGGVGGLLEGAAVVSVLVGTVASVADTTGALKVSSLGLGSGGSLGSVSAVGVDSGGVVVSGWRDFVGRGVVVSCRGARRRLPKEVATGEKDVVEGMPKVGFIEGVVPSCGLTPNVDVPSTCGVVVPSTCGVVVFGASVVALAISVELPVSAGLIGAEPNANPVDPLLGGPKVKLREVLEASLTSSLWPTLKPEKQPRVSPALPWALGA